MAVPTVISAAVEVTVFADDVDPADLIRHVQRVRDELLTIVQTRWTPGPRVEVRLLQAIEVEGWA